MKLRFTISTALLLLCILQSYSQQITNPILSGFYPDPSICKVNSDYYLVNSSFAYYPGLPIFHSTDLLNWQQIGSAMNRPEQLDLTGAGVSRGLFAPAISYHKGIFYIVCTQVDTKGNFVITATDPKGPWSNPVTLPQVNGIDPALFFDEDDKCRIIYNSEPPNNISLYSGHRTIRMYEFDYKNLKITGEQKILVNGGTDITKKPVWIEGPHIYKKDGWYYLLCAEGGTAEDHSEVVFRSKALTDSFIPYEQNPVLTQRHLNPQRKNPITSTGHADLVQDNDGNWWGVFLGCRPYNDNHYNTGRETFIAPVQWKDGWPVFNLGGDEVKSSYPIKARLNKRAAKFSSPFIFKDDFKDTVLNNRYSFLRTVKTKWYEINKGSLHMQLQPQTCSGKETPSFIGFRQPDAASHATTVVNLNAANENEKAGLLVFQNEHHYYFLCKSVQNGQPVIQLYKGPGNKNPGAAPELLASKPLRQNRSAALRIAATGNNYSFYYTNKSGDWAVLYNGADASFLSTKTAGGFTGCFYAMYATSNGQQSNNSAAFNWFECVSSIPASKK